MIIVLLFHISVALSSIAYTTFLFFAPSQRKFYTAYALIGATLATGTYLEIRGPAHILQACISGLVYLAIVATGLALAHARLAAEPARNNDHRDSI